MSDAPATLCVNDAGPPVRACQDALASALGPLSGNARNGTYGHGTAEDVRAFRTTVLGVPVRADGLFMDGSDIDALAGYMDAARLEQLSKPLTVNQAYDAIIWNQGDEGPPIGALQNGLHSALGSEGRPGTNARNGAYGSNTAADLKALGDEKHFPIPADGRGCSYLAWQVVLGYLNEANRANAGKPLKKDVAAGAWVFRTGDEGPPIEAIQAAMASILGPGKTQNARNGKWGSMTTQDLVYARGLGNLTPVGDGKALDKLCCDWLVSFMNATYRAMMSEPLTKSSSGGGTTGQKIADIALEAHRLLAASWKYFQYRPYGDDLWGEFAKTHSDCSSFATLVYKDAGAPDPNGLDYNGYGYTGTLAPRGKSCNPKPGALAFYGPSWSNTGHVTVVVDSGTCISFGSTPISKRVPIAYRSDYLGCREYDLG